MRCMVCGKEMINTIGANYHCTNCGHASNDLMYRPFNFDMPTLQGFEMGSNNIKSDYEQWKEWLDKWGVNYDERTWNAGSKELVIGGYYCLASIVFDLEDNFKDITAYE